MSLPTEPVEPIDVKPACVQAAVDPAFHELLTNCVHCGLCLEVCPTYQLSGDENNSPRGRLRLWREEAEGLFSMDPWTAHYTSECVGCLACEPACPANVPYGRILEHIRCEHVQDQRTVPHWSLRWAAVLATRQPWFNLVASPIRWLRRIGILPHRFLFAGSPAVVETTATYARRMMEQHQPNGPRVAFLTGCLMEAVFREINFSTIRVLIENNLQVIVPESPGCCGAFQEHLGLEGVDALRSHQNEVFSELDVDAVLCNSSGCGLALGKALQGAKPVRDVLAYLSERSLVQRTRLQQHARVYVDLPCHLIHGQREVGVSPTVLNATGYQWSLAPMARDCCGSGGVYNVQNPENARQILARKSEFLNEAEGDPVILATSNHVCMMQWNSARAAGLVTRPYQVRHVIQLLDPGEDLIVNRSHDAEK